MDNPPDPSVVAIRPATRADVPGVLPFVRAITMQHEALDAARFAMLPDVVARYERWLPARAADARSVFLVADAGASGLAGFLVGTVEESIPIYRLSEFGFIHDVWVEPAWRGQGVARALVTEAITRFRAIGVGQVRLETATGNTGAERLFATCGFRVATSEHLIEL